MNDPGLNESRLAAKDADVPGAPAAVSRELSEPSRAQARRLRRANAATDFSRFLTLSLVVHVAVVAAGITGGAAYLRRSGAEARQATIVFNSTPEPLTTSSVVLASAEPERLIENQDRPEDPEPSPLSPQAALAETPALEPFASSFEPSPPPASDVFDRVIGDPRISWRLPSEARSGLQIGLADESRISDCCGEPQPAPAAAPAAEVYVYPEVVKMARAEFPQKSQRLGEHGSVLLEMTVGADGLVKDVRIAESSGFTRIDDCAVAAAWDWIFQPATRNGVPEAALARHRYTFRLTGSGG